MILNKKIVLVSLAITILFAISFVMANGETFHLTSNDSIQAAIDAANDGDTILLSGGIYDKNGDSNVTVNKNLRIIAEENQSPIINLIGKDSAGFTLTADNVELKGLSIIGANATDGGINIQSNNNVINNCSITNNTATHGAGISIGILKENNVIEDCIIVNNTASNENGGGIYVSGSNNNITGSLIMNNHAVSGAGIYLAVEDNIVNNCSIIANYCTGNNYLSVGAGINLASSNNIINNCTIKDHNAYYGAGIYTGDYANKNLINDSKIINNKVSSYGAGLYLKQGSNDNVISGCDINDNVAANNGAGLSLWGERNNITDCNVNGNSLTSATGRGAGIYVNSDNNNIGDCKVKYNNASYGAGVYINSGDKNLINGSNISNNKAISSGAGIYLNSGSKNTVITACDINDNIGSGLFLLGESTNVTDSNINGNNMTYGAGIHVSSNNNNIVNCYVNNNNHGGIYSTGSGNRFSYCTVNSNSGSSNGGGIYVGSNSNIIDSCIVKDNEALQSAGGVYIGNSNNTINNCTVESNHASNGGGISVNNKDNTITQSKITGNTANSSGGGIYNTASLSITNSNFSSNRADNGGAVYNNGSLSVESSSFDTNTANGGTLESGGGAIYDGGSAAITNSKFTRNNILRGTDDGYSWGGAAITVIKHGSVNITNSNFANNSMGAVSIHNDANANIKSSTFVDNNGRGGGALILITFAHADVIDCTFRNNVAEDYGGAIANNGVINIVNSNFSNNRVTNSVYGGGAIANWNWLGDCTVSGSVFENNRAALGGAIYNDKNTPLVNKNNTFKPPVFKGVNDVYQVT